MYDFSLTKLAIIREVDHLILLMTIYFFYDRGELSNYKFTKILMLPFYNLLKVTNEIAQYQDGTCFQTNYF